MAEQLISTTVYVRSEAERPRLGEVVPNADIPVVDLANPDRAAVVAQIGAACSSHGCFQVLSHGLPLEVMMAAMAVAHEFFRLSQEEKAKLYSDDPAKKMRLSTSFNVRKETVHNWRDYLRLHCHPLEQFVPEWPANPPPFREEVRELGFRFYAAISESLGLEQEYIKNVLNLGNQLQNYIHVHNEDKTLGAAARGGVAVGAAARGGAAGGAAAGGAAAGGIAAAGAAAHSGAAGGAAAGGAAAVGTEAGGAAKVSAAARMLNALANVTSAALAFVQCTSADADQ